MALLNRSSKIFLAILIVLTILTTSNTNAMESSSKKVATASEIFKLLKAFNQNNPVSNQLPLDIVNFITGISYAIEKDPYRMLQQACFGDSRDLLIAIHNFHCQLNENDSIKALRNCLKNKNISLCKIKDCEKKTVLHHACQITFPNLDYCFYCLDCLKIILKTVESAEKWQLISAQDIHKNTAFYYTLDNDDMMAFRNSLAMEITFIRKEQKLSHLAKELSYDFGIKPGHYSGSLLTKKKKENCSIQ